MRTRDEQVGAIANDWIVTGMGRDMAHEWAVQMVNEAEARGAEEQRWKDAEARDTPSAYVRPDDFYNDEGDERCGPWSGDQIGKYTLPLYTRPANVAALEARVKELEAEVTALKSKSDDPDDVTCALMDSQYVAGAKFGWNCGQDDDHESLTKMIEGRMRDRIEAGVSFSKRSQEARAALTREGGV